MKKNALALAAFFSPPFLPLKYSAIAYMRERMTNHKSADAGSGVDVLIIL